MASGLFGIEHTNRQDAQHWTKNCFNSSFPTALACYMLSNNMPAIYARLDNVDGQLRVVCDEIPIHELFNCGKLTPSELEFDFEAKFEPYQQYAFDNIDGIDLVVKDLNNHYLSPVEIKLTVLPTSATAKKDPSQWGSEMVIRTATTSYCALGIWNSVHEQAQAIREIFEHSCSDIGAWTNDYEMSHKTVNLCRALDNFEMQYYNYQRPLVMEPLWKTEGQSPILSDNAFDIVVWSDFAFSRLVIDASYEIAERMSRPMRATARMARCLWELSKSGKINIQEIYREIAFGTQTDKELSVPGDRWRTYITTNRILSPIVPQSALNEIIMPGYIENLRPERRFDQTLYYTMRA